MPVGCVELTRSLAIESVAEGLDSREMAQTAAPEAVYEELIGRLVAWREPRSDLRALAAVGSRAQKEASVVEWSDLDDLIVTTKTGAGIDQKSDAQRTESNRAGTADPKAESTRDDSAALEHGDLVAQGDRSNNSAVRVRGSPLRATGND